MGERQGKCVQERHRDECVEERCTARETHIKREIQQERHRARERETQSKRERERWSKDECVWKRQEKRGRETGKRETERVSRTSKEKRKRKERKERKERKVGVHQMYG